MQNQYVQYGCGLSAPHEWLNFDASPTLRIQKTPIISTIFKKSANVEFPSNVKYGDIIKGLPVKENSCAGVYCSHTLQHLSLKDFRIALKNTYKLLKPGGIFRCVVPDLEWAVRAYLRELEKGNKTASISFIGNNTLLGIQERRKGIKGLLTSVLGNSHHLWMWDHYSLRHELEIAGFKNIRTCSFNDSEDPTFNLVEDQSRFANAVALESRKN